MDMDDTGLGATPAKPSLRGKLERNLQASCDAMAAAASFADVAKCDASRPSIPKRPSTGRIGSFKPLAPLPKTAQMSSEDLYMSKFQPIANDNAASAGADSSQSEVRVFRDGCREVLEVL
jgi:hypothetical protein